jgi:hypothetical protein
LRRIPPGSRCGTIPAQTDMAWWPVWIDEMLEWLARVRSPFDLDACELVPRLVRGPGDRGLLL